MVYRVRVWGEVEHVHHESRWGSMSGRLLVTGSRNWTDWPRIERGVKDAAARIRHLAPIVLVHGGARGADSIAALIWDRWSERFPSLCLRPEEHLADWGAFGKAAGHRRNAEMVALGADICAAFPLGESRGTRGCMALARAAGIPVLDYSVR